MATAAAPWDLDRSKTELNLGFHNEFDDFNDTSSRRVIIQEEVNVKSKIDPAAGAKTTESVGYFKLFLNGIRSIWATKQTEETANDRDLRIKTTLRELIIYCFFLLFLSIISTGNETAIHYNYNSVLVNLFINTPGNNSDPNSSFLGLNLPSEYFTWISNVFIPNLYSNWNSWYNNSTISRDIYGYVLYENKLQGVPRIRQVRVKNNSCPIPADFQSQIKVCYAAYSSQSVDKSSFRLRNGTAWNYTESKNINGSSVTGQINTYDAGGFYVDLSSDTDNTTTIFNYLKSNLWIDRATRAVFIDFTLYNANINLFCIIKLIAEFPPTGGIIPSYITRPVQLLKYNTLFDLFILVCQLIACIFIVYYIVEEYLEIKKIGFAYLKEFWNILDILVIVIAVCCIAFNVYCYFVMQDLINYLLLHPDRYINFEFISYWQVIFNSALSIMIFMAWIKIFKYISFNKTMTQLSTTLGACAKDLSGFAIMFFIIFLSFAQLGYLMFGTQLAAFNTYPTSIFTLFRLILGDFNFPALQQANRVLGPAFFILYVFFVFFVLLNMFLAIIDDTYGEVKERLAGQVNDIDMEGYLKRKADKMFSKLNLKKNKISEIQNVLKISDTNGDNIIDFQEWKESIKTRGYSEDEIETVFAKYDINGDRVLDISEIESMQKDLENQKNDLDKINDPKAEMERKLKEFANLQKRVERMDVSIESIVIKIDATLNKLEKNEKVKVNRG